MKRFSIFLLLAAFFVPLAMNAQTKTLKRSATGSTQLEMRVSKEMPSNPLLSRIEPAREAALEELSTIATRAVGDYELVTSEQVDWSGDYVITAMSSSTSAYVMTGKASGGNYGAYTTVTVNNNTISSSAVNSYKVTITEYTLNNTTYCTIKQGNYYLALTQAGNYLYFVTTNPATQTGNNRLRGLWTISYEDDDYVKITNAYTTSRYIRFNNRNNQQRFACYQSSSTSCLEVSLFKYNDGSCVPPTNFQVTDVDLESATFSWTENGSSQYWVLYYMAEDDESSSYEIATSTTFTLTGLTPATTYYALVVPFCGGLDQDSDVIEFTTEDYPCPAPTDLYADDITTTSATLNWTSEAGSYSVHYRIPGNNGETSFFDDFESYQLGDFGDWTVYTEGDAIPNIGLDGWFVYDITQIYQNPPTTSHSGSNSAMAFSYWNGTALTADNWLITPQVELGGTLRFWVYCSYGDAYEVKLSTGGKTISDFTVTLKALALAPTEWTEVEIDLSQYAGQHGYIAIHQDQYDGEALLIDDFGIYGEATAAGPWIPATAVGNSAYLTGLDPETTYEWEVMADCGADGESLWAHSTFTTASPCAVPTGLNTTDISYNSATLGWNAVLSNYNVRYRKGFVYDFESAEPWVEDNFAPCTTYDGDGLTSYQVTDWTPLGTYQYVGSMMAFQGGVTSFGDPHGGEMFGGFVNGIPQNTGDTNNDFLITPLLAIESGDVFEFWASSLLDDWGLERMKVGVYGGNGTITDYLAGSASTYVEVPNGWTHYSYDLSSYAGQSIQLAINCVSSDAYILAIDDIFVGNTNNAWSNSIPVTGGTYPLTGLDTETYYTWQVQGADCDGNGGTTSWASDYFTTLNGIPVESITASDVTVLVGETATITPTVLPTTATNQAVTYTSGDETIATVNENGVVTGVAVGTTTITIAATDGSNVSTDITVTVNGIDVTNIAASDVTVVNGQTATISYTVTPDNATDASVTFTSADETIATVDADGVVTGVSVGNTTITIASVSNPEVTATINVTVTSNPNAVQFTVNAPANAVPGDVITVEGVLTAPTSGTWNGFTGLILDITYDNTAFEYVANTLVYGPVATQAQQKGAFMQSGTIANAVQLAMVITDNNNSVSTEGVVFSAQFTVLAETGEYTFTAEPHDGNLSYGVELLPYEFTPSTVTIGEELYHTFIEGYGNSTTGNYYLIASPIGSVAPTAVVDLNDRTRKMTDGSFDLYYFDNNEELEWINYKMENNEINPDFGNLTPGKGYLYANSQNIELAFIGQAYTGSGEVTLTISDNQYMADWNLVGNPFGQTAYIEDGRDFYTMNSNGTEIVQINPQDISIEPMQGIFVKAEEDGETMNFVTVNPNNNGKGLVLNLFQGNGLIDRTVVRFGEGRTLPKFQIKKNSTKVYIPMEGEDYAVVRSEEVGEMPVNFKAEENGSYTLSFSALNAEFGYLHLIDNMTGNDIDLLATPNYNFTAKTTDYENRFKLVFATGSNDDDSFAFFSNGSFIISNEGNAMLQVIDVNGRILSSENINGSANVNVNAAAGTYMLRLINGDNVKVQKVVVR